MIYLMKIVYIDNADGVPNNAAVPKRSCIAAIQLIT